MRTDVPARIASRRNSPIGWSAEPDGTTGDLPMVTTNGSARPTHTEADYTDFAHTGPGTLAGRFMRHGCS